MRATVLLVLFALSIVPLIASAPAASAVGTCWAKDNDGIPPECPHTFCFGTRWSWGEYYYECQYWLP